jgi:7 transmembrane receptor (rhodopsin family)
MMDVAKVGNASISVTDVSMTPLEGAAVDFNWTQFDADFRELLPTLSSPMPSDSDSILSVVDLNVMAMAPTVPTAFGSADLELLLGPRRQDLVKVIPVTVIYALIFATGLVGNVSTCIVIARNRYMHTATNYCLFNLAVSDLLMLVLGLPQETYTFWSAYPWIFGETFCVLR